MLDMYTRVTERTGRLRKRVSYATTYAALLTALTCVLVGISVPASALTVAELAKTSGVHHQQQVTVVGEVANVVTRYGEKPYSTFDLQDADGVSIPVFIWGPAKWKQGDLYKISGMFVAEKALGTYTLKGGIEADAVEKVSAAELQTVSTVFKKRHRYGIKGARGFHLPE